MTSDQWAASSLVLGILISTIDRLSYPAKLSELSALMYSGPYCCQTANIDICRFIL